MQSQEPATDNQPIPRPPACPVRGGELIEIRAKLQCDRCHRICETCCDAVVANSSN